MSWGELQSVKQQRNCSSSLMEQLLNIFIHVAVLFISSLNNCLCKLVMTYKSDSFRRIGSSESCFCLISLVFFFFLPYFSSFARCFKALELPKSCCSESSSSVNRSWILGGGSSSRVTTGGREEEEGGVGREGGHPAQRSIATEPVLGQSGLPSLLNKCIFKQTPGAPPLTMTNDSTWSFFPPLLT